MQPVLIVRAEPAAGETAHGLEELGYRVVRFPLFEFRRTGVTIPEGEYCAVALTSNNAVRALRELGWKPGNPDLPVYCIGPRTEEAAREYGLTNVRSFHGERNQMVRAIREDHAGTKTPLLYPAAKDRAFDLSSVLAQDGIQTRLVEIYVMERTRPSRDAFLKALAEVENGAIFVHSRRTADYLAELINQSNVANLVSGIVFVCISKQASEPLSTIKVGKLLVADESNEKAMIALLAGEQ